ncbi:competence protein ComF [Arsukibacterium ikkense]|uniref:Competence protein ComF n=1 Tax=Arsukibacterium ikkense TaxID=336831 RepID=A0A0M2V1E8_9GAMM|nr:ComF family protein [Arsukibacterium ikkense]KKO44647.1 competence protein ComF [Arsukibacterium ikkense]
MLNFIGNVLRQSWHYLLPGSCMWCSLPLSQPGSQLCMYCRQALPVLPYQLCHYNLLLLPAIARGLAGAKFDRLVALAVYQQPYQHWIPRWKYHTDLAAGQLLQQQLVLLLLHCQANGMPMPQAITYVPLHWRKQRQRGFNQAQSLAEALARQLQLPVLSLFSKRASPSQRGLSRRQRLHNLRRSFQLKMPHAPLPQHIALIDDVITTGATANALSQLLRRAGVSTISVWTLAVTTPADYSA